MHTNSIAARLDCSLSSAVKSIRGKGVAISVLGGGQTLKIGLDSCQKSRLTFVQFLVNFCKITFMQPSEKVPIVVYTVLIDI